MTAPLRLGALAVMLAATCDGNVSAEPAPEPLKPTVVTGTHIAADPQTLNDAERRQLFEDFSKCVYRTQSDRADYFLRHSDASTVDPELNNASRYLRLADCVNLRDSRTSNFLLNIGVQAMRGWMAEQAYLDRNASYQPPSTLEVLPPRPSYPSRDLNASGHAKAIGAFADCVVAQDGADADALVRTAWGSAEEKAAAKALVPALGVCVVQGESISFKVESIRGFAADGLWQRYEAAKPVTYEGRP